MEDVRILQGDVIERLADIPDESVHLCVTSPPYWALRSYLPDGDPLKQYEIGCEPTPEAHVERLVEVFAHVRRVLHPTGLLFVNYGDCYVSAPNGRKAKDIENDDRTFRDKPMANRGSRSPQPKHQNGNTEVNGPNRNASYGLTDKNLVGMPFRVALGLQADGWIWRSCMPWLKRNCLSGGTRVYARTQKGEMPMAVKDLVRLRPETVQLWNGEKWTQVLDWWETARPEVTYEIELRTGERVGCTGEHRWPTQRGLVEAKDLQVGDVIQTCRLPEPGTPACPSAMDDAMTGWFVGLYIAEGSMSGDTIQISGHIKEEERLARLQAIAKAYHGHCRPHRVGGNSCPIHLHGPMLRGILETYVSGSGAAKKHLNVRCWERSDTFLMAVLEGYLSGDGYWDERNLRWRLGFTRNDNLAYDLRTLCARLGVVLRLRRCKHMLNGRKIDGFRGEVRFDAQTRYVPGGFVRREQGEVVSIGKSNARRFWDIAVADEPHLFALASGVLTHNSMPDSCDDRPGTGVEYVLMFAKRGRYFWDHESVRREHAPRERQGEKNTGWDFGKKRESGAHVGAHTLEYNPNGRGFRNSDLFFEAIDHAVEAAFARWQALRALQTACGLVCEGGDPLALLVNTQPLAEGHYAAYPEKLVEPLILAGTSEAGVCASCGAPWRRIVEKSGGTIGKGWTSHQNDAVTGLKGGDVGERNVAAAGWHTYRVESKGWEKSCRCETNDRQPACVLDPFAGSGTTLRVARRLGRRAIGIELSQEYESIAQRRIDVTPALPGLWGDSDE